MNRIDTELFTRSLVKSRSVAQQLIKEGIVYINGKRAEKNSIEISDDDIIEIRGELPKYVSRGGLKLEGAIKEFNISLDGKVCVDVGASTGGFTDCMLKNGAKKVYAIDVGSEQLDPSLREDERIISFENTDIRAAGEKISEKSDFISVDVSFISLKLILSEVKSFLKNGGEAVILIKPQFEVGKKRLGKNGIVKDKALREKVADDIKSFAALLGFKILGIMTSPITGGDGNTEYLMYIKNCD